MESFTPIASTLGGLMIGLAAAGLLLFSGRIAGISGIAGGLLSRPPRGDIAWRFLFVAGLVAGGAAFAAFAPGAFVVAIDRPMLMLVAAGLLVGFGTRLGNGCTSGHGVCGVSRMSPRSLAATGAFMLTGALTVYLVEHVFGGAR